MRKSLTFLFAAPLLWACTSEIVSVGLGAQVSAPATAAGRFAAQDMGAQVAVGNGIEVQRVRLVVRKLELEGPAVVGSTSSSSDGGTDDDSSGHDGEFETGPFLIDLSGSSLEGQRVSLPEVNVPAGSYDEIEYKIGAPSASEVGQDAALLDMAQRGASVVIDGTIDGAPFSFVSNVTVEQEREVRFEVGGDRAESVTIHIDVSHWFQDAAGARLDPREAGSRSSIENNLQRSIDAFDDHDRDGREDHDDDDDRDGGSDDHGGDRDGGSDDDDSDGGSH
jgi:hypothetical protein